MSKRFAFLFLIIVVGFNLFWGLGNAPLLDPDEPVYAETAREMINFKDYLSPRIYNEFWYDKPPMFYWLVAGTYNLFGVSDWGARFPSAVMGILTILIFYWGMTKRTNEDAAFWSAIVLGVSLEFVYLGKAAVTDMTLLFFLTSALMFYLTRHYYLFYIAMGLATVTKGPIGLVFPCAIIFLNCLFSRNWRTLKEMHIIKGIGLYAVFAVPWYYLMFQAHGQVFIDTFLGFHNITRFTTAEHPGRVLWYYYIPVLLLGIFPWTGMLLSSLRSSLRDSAESDFKLMFFMNIWWIFVFLFFTVSKTKLVSYIFPLFPPIAAIIGWNIARLINRRFNTVPTVMAISSVIMFLAMAGGWFYAGVAFPEISVGATVFAGITVVLAIAIGLSFFLYRDIRLAAACHAVAGIITMFVVFTNLLPEVAPRFSVKEAAEFYSMNCNTSTTIYVDKFLRPGFMFYTNEPGVELLPKSQEALEPISKANDCYVLVRGLELKRWDAKLRDETKVIFSKDDIYILEK